MRLQAGKGRSREHSSETVAGLHLRGDGGKWSDSGNITEVERTGLVDALEVGGGKRRGIRDSILARGLNNWAQGGTMLENTVGGTGSGWD